jgi:hypothetical protein
MKTDLYTKIVLTIIAVCLVVIAIERTNFTSVANADSDNIVPVVIRGIDRAGGQNWETIKVEVQK